MCPLCETEIQTGHDTLDHCHQSGHTRRVLCRNCNQIEGRVLSWLRRSYTEPITFLRNLVMYWEQDYEDTPIHPNHKTDIEKKIMKLKRRMRTLKTERARQKYRDKIRKLKEQL